MNDKTKYWLDLAEYDIETVRQCSKPDAISMWGSCATRQ